MSLREIEEFVRQKYFQYVREYGDPIKNFTWPDKNSNIQRLECVIYRHTYLNL